MKIEWGHEKYKLDFNRREILGINFWCSRGSYCVEI